MISKNNIVRLVVSIVIFMSFTSLAYAHRVNVFAWVEGKTIFIESKFASGRVVKKGELIIENQKKEIVFKGTTDQNGKFEFVTETPSDYLIIVNAGVGHQGKWQINKNEFSEHEGDNQNEKTEEIQTVVPKQEEEVRNHQGIAVSTQEIEEILDRKLADIKSQLKMIRQDRENKIRDIISGIGFILGIFGVVAILKSKKG